MAKTEKATAKTAIMVKHTILMQLLDNKLNVNFLMLQHILTVVESELKQKPRIREKVKDAGAR